MNKKDLLRAFNSVDEKFIDEADPTLAESASAPKGGRLGVSKIRRIIVIAASLCLVTALSLVLFLPFNTENEAQKHERDPYYKVISALDAMNKDDDAPKNNFEVIMGTIGDLFGSKDVFDYVSKDSVNMSGNNVFVEDFESALPPPTTPDGSNGSSNEVLGNGKYEEVTDNQVSGVIEADIIKRTDKYVFYLERGYSGNATIRVYYIAGESSAQVASLPISFWSEAINVYSNECEFYLSEDANTVTLITHGYSKDHKVYTEIIPIDVSNVTNIRQNKSVVLTGNYVSSRNTNGNILLITRFSAAYDPDFSDESTFLPQIIIEGKAKSVAPDDIILPDVLDSRIYTVVTMLDADSLEVKGNVAYLSYSDTHYVSEDTVYITRRYIGERTEGDVVRGGPVTEIVALKYSAIGLEKKGSVTVEGRVKNQYSMDQHDGILRVVTTTETYVQKVKNNGNDTVSAEIIDSGASNAALWCIDLKTMKVVASVVDFAPDGETVESVRFDGDYAYVCTAVTITYRDPVFFFDLSDLDNITYKDTGDIEGYSSSLVDFGDGYLLGIGYGANRNILKIEIYVETENGVVSLCSYEREIGAFSEDYKSYYIDRENSLIGLGYNGLGKISGNIGWWGNHYLVLHFNGVELVEMFVAKMDATPVNMRGFYADDYFYIFAGKEFEVVKLFNAVK